MTLPAVAPCDHELRPGTAVCLRCQHAARAAKRAHQRTLIVRGAVAALVVGLIGAVGFAAWNAWSGLAPTAPSTAPDLARMAPPTDAQADSISGPGSSAPGPELAAGAGVLASPAGSASVVTPIVATAGATTPPIATSSLAPTIPLGRTALRDTMTAERAGDTVRVSFDLLLSRTRRPDKFEAIVRSTLPQVYGAAADSALQSLPVGAVARAGDLTTTLPERGFRIPLPDGRAIAVWPETRAGRDGPLVVSYRAVAAPPGGGR